MMRENRLYQTDWLLRFYGFDVREILNEQHQNLDMDIDPKLSWALRNLDQFPIDINRAEKRMLARIPGVGMKSVGKILSARRYRRLGWDHLKAIGISMNRSKYFITCNSREFESRDLTPIQIKSQILLAGSSKYSKNFTNQLSLF